MDEQVYIDPIGGCHSEGLGWAPDGTFCGECCSSTCEGCKSLLKMTEDSGSIFN